MSGTPVKHHAALKLILRGQDLALGHINLRQFCSPITDNSKLSLHFL